MKYFQSLADIRNEYDDVLEKMEDNGKVEQLYLGLKGLTLDDKPLLEEEREVLHYLIACQHGVNFGKGEVRRPTVEVVNRCFNRHLADLEDVYGITYANVNKFGNPMIEKQFKACHHYLFKFSLTGWVLRMPMKIESFEDKYAKKT